VGTRDCRDVAAATYAKRRLSMFRGIVTRRWPEISLFLFGCALRIALGSSYNVRLGYDFYDHARNIAWWMQHADLPPIDWSRAAYHPPLYYVLAGRLARAGLGFTGLGLISVALGCLRLGLLVAALELYLPRQRMARLVALALAAVLPASVHMDVMVTNEGLAATLSMLALVLLPLVFSDSTRTRWYGAVGLGFALGLAILTKVSSLVIVAALCAAALFQFARDSAGGTRGRLQRLAPMLTALAIVVLCSGWYFAWCKVHYGKAFITGFDSWRSKASLLHADKPYWNRRPPGYLLGWNLDIYAFPFYPSAALPRARFFPQLVAATFADYYNYGLAPYPGVGDATRLANQRPARPAIVRPASVSVGAGTLIALISVVAWAAAWVVCWRQRAHAMLGLLLVPLLAVAGQAHFAVTVANDTEGLVKGSYLQFGVAPLFALFGLGVAWLWRHRPYRFLAALGLTALLAVAWYVVFCIFVA